MDQFGLAWFLSWLATLALSLDLLGDQMTKNFLLTAVAATALIVAGSAQAGSLSARGGAVAVAPNNPYKLASELNFGAGVASTVGQFDTVFTFNAPLNAGSYTVTLAYTGATITTPIPTTTVNSATLGNTAGNQTDASGFEVASAAGGNGSSQLTVVNQTSTQVTFALQIPAGNTVTSIFAAPALLVTGPVSVTAAVTNQVTGAVVDPAVIQPLITTNNRSFASRINRAITGADAATFGAGAGLDTRVEEGGGGNPFNTLTGGANPYQIGQVDVAVAGSGAYDTIIGSGTSTAVYRDLNGTAVSLNDVASVTTSITGLFGGLTVTAADTIGGLPAAQVTGTGNVRTVTTPGVAAPGATGVGTTTVYIAPTTAVAASPQIAPTDFDVTATVNLVTGFNSPTAVVGSFETLQTDGFSYIIPWVASQTQSGASGNQSVIRVSNIRSDGSTSGGNVYVQVYNPTTGNAGLSAGRSVLVGTIGLTGELVLTSQSLEAALGNFGRADLRLTVTTTATDGNNLPGGVGTAAGAATTTTAGSSTIVVKRLIATSNGGLTEVEILSGSPTSVANNPNNQGVAY